MGVAADPAHRAHRQRFGPFGRVLPRDLLGLELIVQWDSSQPYLRAIVAYPEAELRIALLRLPAAGDGGPGHHIELLEYRRPRSARCVACRSGAWGLRTS
jgi:hypothetical protein